MFYHDLIPQSSPFCTQRDLGDHLLLSCSMLPCSSYSLLPARDTGLQPWAALCFAQPFPLLRVWVQNKGVKIAFAFLAAMLHCWQYWVSDWLLKPLGSLSYKMLISQISSYPMFRQWLLFFSSEYSPFIVDAYYISSCQFGVWFQRIEVIWILIQPFNLLAVPPRFVSAAHLANLSSSQFLI